MEIEVLGCHGGEVPGFSFCSLRVDGKLLVDAGRVTSVLPVAMQRQLEHVFIGHSHFDHWRDLPALAQNRACEQPAAPLSVWGLAETIEAMRQHVLNGTIWPDFESVPSGSPSLVLRTIGSWESVVAGIHRLTAVPMLHSVPSSGVVIERGGVGLMVSGDGDPTAETCERLRSWPGLAACVFEATFCNAQEDLARRTGHMTPRILGERLQRIGRSDIEVFVYHVSPACYKEIAQELDEIPTPVRLLQAGERLRLS